MRKIIVLSMVSLDGVLQAPGGRDEDASGGFRFGGWTVPFTDDIYRQAVQRELQPAAYLLGRKTFEIWEKYWPKHNDFWPAINQGQKYVLSTTRNKSDWQNSVFIEDLEDLKRLKKSLGKDLHVWGSSELVHLLLAHDLVDELRLKIYPVLLGKGKKLFDTDAHPATFTLTDSTVTKTGVILANYKRAGTVKTGKVGA
ncbi:dihydrofolate reductase family protein [Flavobacterium sp.]|uniref:dihydrofolate reductase family protein n=1 Tax=Flavobacterium sp. TaxID=239 RepID=UPI0039E4039F